MGKFCKIWLAIMLDSGVYLVGSCGSVPLACTWKPFSYMCLWPYLPNVYYFYGLHHKRLDIPQTWDIIMVRVSSFALARPFGWLISVKYWLLQREEAVYSTPFAKVRRFICSRNNRRWQERGEIWPGISYIQWDSDVWRSQWQKREKSEQCHSVERGQQHLQVILWYRLLNATFLTGLRQALMNKQIYCIVIGTIKAERLQGIVGNRLCWWGFFFSWLKPTDLLLYLSKQEAQRPSKLEFIHTSIMSLSFTLCYSVYLTFVVTKIM